MSWIEDGQFMDEDMAEIEEMERARLERIATLEERLLDAAVAWESEAKNWESFNRGPERAKEFRAVAALVREAADRLYDLQDQRRDVRAALRELLKISEREAGQAVRF